jgi:CubicO group peptidase (beta-lactamase class C family)
MLMTHASGICDNWPVILSYATQGDPDTPMRTFLEDYFVPGRPGYDSALNFYQNSPPGANCAYCNAAVTLLALHVETMAESFPLYTRDSIFEPLGMDRTTWFFADLDTMSVACPYQWVSGWRRFGYLSGSFYPVAALKSCTRDLGTYLNMWLAFGRHDSLQLLDSATVELMLMPHVWDPLSQGWQGLIWYQETIDGDTVWCHSGGWNGVCTYVALSRRDNSGVIALTNGDANQVYNNLRGQVVPALHGFAVGIAEEPGPSVNWKPRSSFVRGVLELGVDSRLKTGHMAELLDAAGRNVLGLHLGANDVSRLAPGVYFVRQASSVMRDAPSLSKVVIAR